MHYNQKQISLLSIVLIIFFLSSAKYSPAWPLSLTTEIVHGNDDRQDPQVFEKKYYNNSSKTKKFTNYKAFVTFSKSVAIKVPKNFLSFNTSTNMYQFTQNYLLQDIQIFADKNFCPDVPFLKQRILGSCSGFLKEPDILITAGHCAQSILTCDDYYWVFNYKNTDEQILPENVVECSDVESHMYESNTKVLDYSVVKLDRKITHIKPLKVRTRGNIRFNTPLILIGYPAGLPLKIDDGAVSKFMSTAEYKDFFNIIKKRSYFFTANTDSFQGNSGSPIFNKKTGLVEGILISGDDDYVFNKKRNCTEIKKVSNSNLETNEIFFKIRKVKY